MKVNETCETSVAEGARAGELSVCTLTPDVWFVSSSNSKRFVKPTTVVVLPAFVMVDEYVVATLVKAVIGVAAEAVKFGWVTVIAVHTPQLFPSFDSVMVPVFAAELLSAHARTYHVAAEGKVYDLVAVKLPPAETLELRTYVPISVEPVPDESVAR
jgi:hypothetical protein